MTPGRKKDQLKSELIGLEDLAKITPEGPFGRSFVEQRAAELRAELAAVEQTRDITPQAEIFFAGPRVYGSQGIDAKFAAQILDSYQDMVTNDFASHQGALRHMGRRHGEEESRVFLTALPRGSMGLQLSQPLVNDFVTALQVSDAMEHVTDLVRASTEGDEPFEKALEVFHPRVLAPLTRFLDTVTKASATCRIVTSDQDLSFERDRLAAAYQRVVAAKTSENIEEVLGTFGGVLLHSSRFELQPQVGSVLTGWLADSLTESEAEAMALFTGKPVLATLKVTSVSTATGRKKPVYELLKISPPEAPSAPRLNG